MSYGLEVHKKFIQVCHLDAKGANRKEYRIGGSAEEIDCCAQGLGRRDQVVLETTFYSEVPADLLARLSEQVPTRRKETQTFPVDRWRSGSHPAASLHDDVGILDNEIVPVAESEIPIDGDDSSHQHGIADRGHLLAGDGQVVGAALASSAILQVDPVLAHHGGSHLDDPATHGDLLTGEVRAFIEELTDGLSSLGPLDTGEVALRRPEHRPVPSIGPFYTGMAAGSPPSWGAPAAPPALG